MNSKDQIKAIQRQAKAVDAEGLAVDVKAHTTRHASARNTLAIGHFDLKVVAWL